MTRIKKRASSISAMALIAMLIVPVCVPGQTPVKAPSNKYSVRQDVEAGSQAAADVERQLPMLNNREVEGYVDGIGRRLAEAIPPEFQHPEFRYSFKVANVSDLNAFALPGGFTYVNRGMIQAARSEGELAGVMAHEISHVALRHGTAQASKAGKYQTGSVLGQVLGAVIGGPLGGVVGAASQMGFGLAFLKYSREYERQADTLGAQIMARAGYDPRELANVFQLLEQQSRGSGGPEWMSSHPNPGNRYEAINKEAQMLRVSNPARNSGEFQEVQAYLRRMSPAPSMEQVARSGQRYPQDTRQDNRRYPDDGNYPNDSRYGRVDNPSTRFRTYNESLFRIAVPENWREIPGNGDVTFAPSGAYGQGQGITHGVIVGVAQAQSRDLQQATDYHLRSLAQGNQNLRQQSGYQRGTVAGRTGIATTLTNVSDITGRPESVIVYTTFTRRGELFYMIGVAPQEESRNYQGVFQSIMRSVQLND